MIISISFLKFLKDVQIDVRKDHIENNYIRYSTLASAVVPHELQTIDVINAYYGCRQPGCNKRELQAVNDCCPDDNR